jgi:hypothetical protein
MSAQIKARVKIGTLQFEQKTPVNPDGIYNKGDVIIVSEERFKQFDVKDVEFIGLAQVETKPAEVPIVEVATEPIPQIMDGADVANVEAKPLGAAAKKVRSIKATLEPATTEATPDA